MRTRFPLVVLALAAFALSAATASADPKKPYTVTIDPATASAGAEVVFTVTITNNAKQTLGAANVTVPSDFMITNDPTHPITITRGSVTLSGKDLQLRNLSLATNGVVTVTLGVKMPCKPDTYPWIVVAKQANDFHGAGNDMGPVSGPLSTTVTAASGAPTLRFVENRQPASAERNAQIRAEAFQPESDLVAVEALDRCSQPVTGTIELRLVEGGPVIASAPLVAGVASFSNLSIAQSGNYTLVATTAAGGSTSAPSNRFQIIDVVNDCTATSCTATLTGTNTTSTVTGTGGTDVGFVLLSFKLGPDPLSATGCAGYTPPTGDWYEFRTTVQRTKTVEAEFKDKAGIQQIGGVSKLQICFAAPLPFTVKGGGTSPSFDYDGLAGNGAEGFAGLLPDCPYKPTGPCILKRQSVGGDDHYRGDSTGGAIVKFLVPSQFGGPGGDPRYH